MKAVYKQLVDKSVAAALAAIEVYNKPDFRYEWHENFSNCFLRKAIGLIWT
jgi:hypothetical protein